MIKGFADITAGQVNHYFVEIAPRTVYPLYGIICHLEVGKASLHNMFIINKAQEMYQYLSMCSLCTYAQFSQAQSLTCM